MHVDGRRIQQADGPHVGVHISHTAPAEHIVHRVGPALCEVMPAAIYLHAHSTYATCHVDEEGHLAIPRSQVVKNGMFCGECANCRHLTKDSSHAQCRQLSIRSLESTTTKKARRAKVLKILMPFCGTFRSLDGGMCSAYVEMIFVISESQSEERQAEHALSPDQGWGNCWG